MINVCTVSDINYLNKGLVLYESLLTNKDVVFHYLCIDEESYNKLIKHSSDTLKVYNINVFLGSDVTLKNLKERQITSIFVGVSHLIFLIKC